MKERPILFSAPMVRAILDGTKTQTRRVVKPQPPEWVRVCYGSNGLEHSFFDVEQDGEVVRNWPGNNTGLRCPYGQTGDRLWVREAWMPDAPCDGTWPHTSFYGCDQSPLSEIPERFRKPKHCLFRSTWQGHELIGWKPSIHMPRWASRITLEITGVRRARLQGISESDAQAEGVRQDSDGWIDYLLPDASCCSNAVDSYRTLWESINGAGSWDKNPWLWVIEFKRVNP